MSFCTLLILFRAFFVIPMFLLKDIFVVVSQSSSMNRIFCAVHLVLPLTTNLCCHFSFFIQFVFSPISLGRSLSVPRQTWNLWIRKKTCSPFCPSSARKCKVIFHCFCKLIVVSWKVSCFFLRSFSIFYFCGLPFFNLRLHRVPKLP